jgi:hypothetical protein
VTWQVRREGADVVVQQGTGAEMRLPLGSARTVRIVPLTGGDHHRSTRSGGWQVTLARADGDVLVGQAQGDWRAARELARLLCATTDLPLDELSARMFSRAGGETPTGEG